MKVPEYDVPFLVPFRPHLVWIGCKICWYVLRLNSVGHLKFWLLMRNYVNKKQNACGPRQGHAPCTMCMVQIKKIAMGESQIVQTGTSLQWKLVMFPSTNHYENLVRDSSISLVLDNKLGLCENFALLPLKAMVPYFDLLPWIQCWIL